MGRVCHFELPADDLARAKKFYSTVFGWEMCEYPEMKYTILRTSPSDENGTPKEAGSINGGMLARQDPVKTPVITIGVDDMDEATKAIEKNGGKIIQPKMAVSGMGFAAYFRDTEGNVVGLFEPA